jgi:hypothetical protein
MQGFVMMQPRLYGRKEMECCDLHSAMILSVLNVRLAREQLTPHGGRSLMVWAVAAAARAPRIMAADFILTDSMAVNMLARVYLDEQDS